MTTGYHVKVIINGQEFQHVNDFELGKKRRPFVGVRYKRRVCYSSYTSTLVATIFIGNRRYQTSGVHFSVDGRVLISPHLYVAHWPQRAGLVDLTPGFYVQPGQYTMPEGRFKKCFTRVEEAVEHGRAVMKELLAAHTSLRALGVG